MSRPDFVLFANFEVDEVKTDDVDDDDETVVVTASAFFRGTTSDFELSVSVEILGVDLYRDLIVFLV